MYSILTKQWQQKLANNGIDTTNQVKDYIKERKAKSILPMGGTKREQHVVDTKQI